MTEERFSGRHHARLDHALCRTDAIGLREVDDRALRMIAAHLQPPERDQQTGVRRRAGRCRACSLDAGDGPFEPRVTVDVLLDDHQQIQMQGVIDLGREFETLGGLCDCLGVEFEHPIALGLQ
jgi:hypothetical protein